MGDGRGETPHGIGAVLNQSSFPESAVEELAFPVPFDRYTVESGEIKSFARSIRARIDHVALGIRRIVRPVGLG